MFKSSFPLFIFILALLELIQTLTINQFEIRDLEDTTSYLETEAAPWTITNNFGGTTKTTSCTASYRIIGGYGITGYGTTFSRTYNPVVQHNLIQFSIVFFVLDMPSGTDLFKITFDNQLAGTWDSNSMPYSTTSAATNICGGSQVDYPSIVIKGQIPHANTALTLTITSLNDGTASNTFSLGFREVSLLFKNATSGSLSTCALTTTVTFGSTLSCLCTSGSYDVSGLSGCTGCENSCSSCQAGTALDCTSCKSGYSWSGIQCSQCASSCTQCNGTAANQCLRCSSSNFLYWNNTCLGTCGFPLVQTVQGIYKSCALPCNNSGYYYQNNTCASSCDQNFNVSNVGDLKYCNFTCYGSDYLYWNGSCYSTCDAPLVKNIQGLGRYCELPCGTSGYLYQNLTCDSNCLAPFVKSNQGDLKYCSAFCPSPQFYYWNNTCNETCDFPLVSVTKNVNESYCELPCGTSGYYYSNHTCKSNCDYPFEVTTQGDLKYCNFKCAGSDFLYWNGSCYSTCDDPLVKILQGEESYCELPCGTSGYYYQNKTCSSDCTGNFVTSNQGDLKYCNFYCPSSSEWLNPNNRCNATCNSPLLQKVQGLAKYCYSPCSDDSQYINTFTATIFRENRKTKHKKKRKKIFFRSIFFFSHSVLYFIQIFFLDFFNADSLGLIDKRNNLNSVASHIWDTLIFQKRSKFAGLKKCSRERVNDNGTCSTTCDSPYSQRTEGTYKFCYNHCPAGQYLYWNGSCSSYCPSSFRVNYTASLECKFYCPLTEFLYWNTTCYSTCDSPLVKSMDSESYKSCSRPCSSGYELHNNGSCMSSVCSYQSYTDQNGVDICNYPCNSSEYYVGNSTVYGCLAACNIPYYQVINITANETLCNPPCPKGSGLYYYIDEKTCTETCKAPQIKGKNGTVLTCQNPLEETFAQKIASVIETLGSLTNFLRPNSLYSIFMTACPKMLKYIRFIDVSIPEDVRSVLDPPDIGFSMPDLLSYPMLNTFKRSLGDREIPEVFQRKDVHSSYLWNQWNNLSTLSIVVFIGLVLSLSIRSIKKLKTKIPHYVNIRLLLLLKWNFVISLFFNCYDDFTLYLFFELRTVHFDSFPGVLSFLTCLIVTGFAGYFLVQLFKCCRELIGLKTQTLDQNSLHNQTVGFYKKWRNFQVFYPGFKDSSLPTQSFLLISTVRIIISYFFVGVFFAYPLVQTFFFVLMSCGIIWFLLKTKPIKNSAHYYFAFSFEIIIFIANISLFILAVLDHQDDKKETSFKTNFSNIFPVLVLLMILLATCYLIICLILCIHYCYKTSQTAGAYRKTVWLNLLTCMYSNPGMFFDEKSNELFYNIDSPAAKVQNKRNNRLVIAPISAYGFSSNEDVPTSPANLQFNSPTSANTPFINAVHKTKNHNILPQDLESELRDQSNNQPGSSNEISNNDDLTTERRALASASVSFNDSSAFSPRSRSRLRHPTNRILLNSISTRMDARRTATGLQPSLTLSRWHVSEMGGVQDEGDREETEQGRNQKQREEEEGDETPRLEESPRLNLDSPRRTEGRGPKRESIIRLIETPRRESIISLESPTRESIINLESPRRIGGRSPKRESIIRLESPRKESIINLESPRRFESNFRRESPRRRNNESRQSILMTQLMRGSTGESMRSIIEPQIIKPSLQVIETEEKREIETPQLSVIEQKEPVFVEDLQNLQTLENEDRRSRSPQRRNQSRQSLIVNQASRASISESNFKMEFLQQDSVIENEEEKLHAVIKVAEQSRKDRPRNTVVFSSY